MDAVPAASADGAGTSIANGVAARAALQQELLSPTTPALLALARAGPQALVRLIAVLGLSPTDVTPRGNRLVAAALAGRSLHPTNRRMRLLTLTAQGKAAATLLRAAFADLVSPRSADATSE